MIIGHGSLHTIKVGIIDKVHNMWYFLSMVSIVYATGKSTHYKLKLVIRPVLHPAFFGSMIWLTHPIELVI
jgi:hypothetical protein